MNEMDIILPFAGCFTLILCMIGFYLKRHFIKHAANLDKNVLSPLDGELVKYTVEEGTCVKKYDTIVLMKASNIELEIRAHCTGKIYFLCTPGSYIEKNTVIAQIFEN